MPWPRPCPNNVRSRLALPLAAGAAPNTVPASSVFPPSSAARRGCSALAPTLSGHGDREGSRPDRAEPRRSAVAERTVHAQAARPGGQPPDALSQPRGAALCGCARSDHRRRVRRGRCHPAAVGDGSDWDMGVRYPTSGPTCGSSMRLGSRGTSSATSRFWSSESGRSYGSGCIRSSRVCQRAARRACPAGAGRSGRKAPLDGGWFLSRARHLHPDEGRCTRPDPLTRVHAGGGHVRVQDVDDCLPCQGGQDTLLEANRRMLEEMAPDVEPTCLERSQIQGPAWCIRPHGSRTALSAARRSSGRVLALRDAYVGPYTSIGADVVMEGAEIEHSIVFSGAEIRYVGARLESSVIGQGARVCRSFRIPAPYVCPSVTVRRSRCHDTC